MKRFISLTISLLLIFPLFGCAAEDVAESMTTVSASSEATSSSSAVAAPIATPGPAKVVAVDIPAAITDAGDLYIWDGRQPDAVKMMSGVKAVSVGQGFYLALTQSGEVYAWGDNTDGQLGNGDFGYTEDEPIKIMEDVKFIDAGRSHALAITNGGELYVWGNNPCGQIGDGTDGARQTTPKKIMDGVETASAGAETTAAVTENGDLYVWGYNNEGAIGNGEYRKEGSDVFVTTPLKVMSGVASVSTTGSITAAITTDGELYTWGNNECGLLGSGQIGDGDRFTWDAIVPTPQKVMDGVAYVAVGDWTVLAIDTAQNLYIWGQTEYGQLGDGAVGDGDPYTYDMVTTVPKMVMSGVTSAACTTSALAVNAAGELYGWGGNGSLPTRFTLDPNAQPVETETASASASVKTPFPAAPSDFSLNGCSDGGSIVADAGVLYMPEIPVQNSLLKIDLVNQTMESIGLQYAPVLAMTGVYNDYVYYMGDGQIARIKTDGSASSRVFRAEDGQQLVGFGANSSYIYAYTLSGEQNIVSRVDVQTGDTVILSNVQQFPDAVDDDGLYYITDTAITRTDLEGSNVMTVIKGGQLTDLSVSNGWLYYLVPGNNGVALYRARSDGTGKGRIGKIVTAGGGYDVAGDTVYYYNAADNGKLYCIGVDGSGKKKLSDAGWIQGISVFAGRLLVSTITFDEKTNVGKMRYDFMLPDGSDVIDMTAYLIYQP